MNKYEILIFDLDDTLIDNKENIKHAFKKILEYMNEPYADSKFDLWYKIDTKFWIDRLNGKIIVPEEYREPLSLMVSWVRSQRFLIYFNNITLERAMELNDIYIEELKEVVVGTDNVYEVLEYLSKKYTIIVGTNGPSIAAYDKVKKIDCLKFVTHVIAADMVGYMKPNIEFFNYIKDKTNNLDNTKYLVIGDSIKTDIVGAENAKIDSCWYNHNNEINETEYKPTIEIKDLKELITIL